MNRNKKVLSDKFKFGKSDNEFLLKNSGKKTNSIPTSMNLKKSQHQDKVVFIKKLNSIHSYVSNLYIKIKETDLKSLNLQLRKSFDMVELSSLSNKIINNILIDIQHLHKRFPLSSSNHKTLKYKNNKKKNNGINQEKEAVDQDNNTDISEGVTIYNLVLLIQNLLNDLCMTKIQSNDYGRLYVQVLENASKAEAEKHIHDVTVTTSLSSPANFQKNLKNNQNEGKYTLSSQSSFATSTPTTINKTKKENVSSQINNKKKDLTKMKENSTSTPNFFDEIRNKYESKKKNEAENKKENQDINKNRESLNNNKVMNWMINIMNKFKENDEISNDKINESNEEDNNEEKIVNSDYTENAKEDENNDNTYNNDKNEIDINSYTYTNNNINQKNKREGMIYSSSMSSLALPIKLTHSQLPSIPVTKMNAISVSSLPSSTFLNMSSFSLENENNEVRNLIGINKNKDHHFSQSNDYLYNEYSKRKTYQQNNDMVYMTMDDSQFFDSRSRQRNSEYKRFQRKRYNSYPFYNHTSYMNRNINSNTYNPYNLDSNYNYNSIISSNNLSNSPYTNTSLNYQKPYSLAKSHFLTS